MRTLGVDLASQPANTGVCRLVWEDGGASVEHLEADVDDDHLLSLVDDSDCVGIDAPFGWPDAYVDVVAAHRAGRGETAEWDSRRRVALRYRQTDRAMKDALGRWPLSPSTDLIGVPTLRCAGLLARLGVEDRSGDGRVYEVYPAVALHRWGFRTRGYKGQRHEGTLARLFVELHTATPWLSVSEQQAARLVENGDLFDALVCALAVRAAVQGLVDAIPERHRAVARREGWTVVPVEGSLEGLL